MRVIAGSLRGHPLRAPRGMETRPTTDRVREALFSILGNIQGARVLDLYAGSGALGIEALSRGAEFATFVEFARPAMETLRGNLAALRLVERSATLALRAERAGQALAAHGPFDLIFCDPPWPKMDTALDHLPKLLQPELLNPGAVLVVEHPARISETELNRLPWPCSDRRAWGDTGASLFDLDAPSMKKLSDSEPSSEF